MKEGEMKIITTCASLTGQSAAHWRLCASLNPLTHIAIENESCIAAARNRQLTAVHRTPGWDVCLMLDDDVFASVGELYAMCRQTALFGDPIAALYPTAKGDVRLQVAPNPDDARRHLVLAGLGALAFTREHLSELASLSQWVRRSSNKDAPEFCAFTQSSISPFGTWWNEDAWLCYKLGGVEISRAVRAMHRKLRNLQLSEEEHARIIEHLELLRKQPLTDDV